MKFRINLFLAILLALACPTFLYAQGSVKESDQLDFAQGLLSRGMYDMAIAQYQKFILDYPHSASLPQAYLSLGEGYFLSQDFDHAVNIFSQFRQLYPNSDQLPVSILRLGQIDIQQKKYDDALKELTSIDVQKQLQGGMLQAFDYYTAEAYWGKADIPSALEFFQKATQVSGAVDYTADAFKEIGRVQAQNGQYSQSMDAYASAMKLAGDDQLKAEVMYDLAETQFLADRYTDAIKSFQQVLDQYPGSGFIRDALANLLLSYFNLGQYDQLISEYQKRTKQIKDDETYFEVHFAAVMATIELKEYDQADKLLDKLLSTPSLKPQETAKVFIEKADILIRQKKFQDGLAMLQAHSSQDINDTDESLFLKGQSYFGLGDFDHAYTFFENVYLNFPHSRFYMAALLGQAHARQEMGRLKESEALFLKYYEIQDQPDLKSESLYDAIIIALRSGDTAQVISSAQEYLKTFPSGEKYTEVLLTLADMYGKNDQPQLAVKLLQGYLAGPSVGRPNVAYFLLGFDQQALGNSDQALAAYTQVDGHKEDGKFYAAALKNMAIIYLTQKKNDQARSYFDRLISQKDPNDLQVKTYIWVCNEYLKEQQYLDVLRVANQAEKHFSLKDLQEIKYFKAEALRAMGNCDEASKDYSFVLSSPQKNVYTASAHIGYGVCLANAQKYDDARKEFQSSLDEDADDYTVTLHARFEMANTDAAQGNLDDALKFYLLVATLYDDNYYCSESLLRAAKISEKLGRKADALKMYAEILDKYKNSAAAVYAKGRVDPLK